MQLDFSPKHATNSPSEVAAVLQKAGAQEMNIQIFNIIQLMKLVTLCCEGKSEIAERYSKQFILSFQVCGNIIVHAGNFWPLKIAVLNYALHAYMDASETDSMFGKKE